MYVKSAKELDVYKLAYEQAHGLIFPKTANIYRMY